MRPLALLPLAACSVNGAIEGRVISHIDGKPVAGVTVGVEGTTITAETDVDGAYRLAGVVPGRQQVVVTSDNVAATELRTLTVGSWSTVEAEDLKVVPRPPTPGAFALVDGAPTPLWFPPNTRWNGVAGTVGMDRASYPIEQMTAVAGDVAIVLLDEQKTAREVHLYRALENNDFVGFRWNERVYNHSWEVAPKSPLEAKGESFPGGVHLVRASLPPGVYAVQEDYGGLEGTSTWLFRVLPRGPSLAIRADVYDEGTPEFEQAREGLRTWCAGAQGDDAARCAEAKPILDTAFDPWCRGRLVLPKNGSGAHFHTGSCRSWVNASLTAAVGGWYFEGIEILPPEEEQLDMAGADVPADASPTAPPAQKKAPASPQEKGNDRVVASAASSACPPVQTLSEAELRALSPEEREKNIQEVRMQVAAQVACLDKEKRETEK